LVTTNIAEVINTLNICVNSAKALIAQKGTTLLAVPFRARARYYKDHPLVTTNIAEVINILDICVNGAKPCCKEAIVVPPKTAPSLSKGGKNAPPFPLVLSNITAQYRTWLISEQTFDVSPCLAFNIVKIDPHPRSWTIAAIGSDSHGIITEGRKDSILIDIKKQLFKDTAFKRETAAILRLQNRGANDCKRILAAMETFLLTLVPVKDKFGIPNPYYLLKGEPLTTDAVSHNRWIATIKNMKYMHHDISPSPLLTTLQAASPPGEAFSRSLCARWTLSATRARWTCTPRSTAPSSHPSSGVARPATTRSGTASVSRRTSAPKRRPSLPLRTTRPLTPVAVTAGATLAAKAAAATTAAPPATATADAEASRPRGVEGTGADCKCTAVNMSHLVPYCLQ
jgi:hypothetical protein